MPLRPSWSTILFALVLACAAPAAAVAAAPVTLAQPGKFSFPGASLVVANLGGSPEPDIAGIRDTNVVVAVNGGSGTFSTLRTFSMGSSALVAFASADVDTDGLRDFVAVSAGTSLVVRLNAPGMIFGNVIVSPLPSRGQGLALGDLDGDGLPDAVTMLPDSDEVAICPNVGGGAFGPPIVFTVGSSFTEPLLGDFNGDGHPDVLVATAVPLADWLIAGHGDGTFDAPVVAVTPDAYRPALTAADFDGDGDLDLAAVGPNDVAIHWNAGNGTFSAAQVLPAGYLEVFHPSVGRIAAGDMDRDGRPDLVVGGTGPSGFDNGNHYLAVFPNLGGGAFGNARQYRVGVYPHDVAVADLDGDGWLDGVATCAGLGEQGSVGNPNQVAAAFVLASAHEAGLTALLEVYQPVWLPARPGADSLPDLYGSHGNVTYRARNLGHGIFADAESIGTGDPVVARDLDGDGSEDLLIANSDTLSVRLNRGAAGLDAPLPLPDGLAFEDFADADGDGRPDFFASDSTHRVWIAPGDGTGHFGAAIDTGVDVPLDGSVEWPVAARDVNGDGFADLLFAVALPIEENSADSDGHFVHRLDLITRLGDGLGGFGAPDTAEAVFTSEFAHDGGGGRIVFGNWNGDGWLDVACGAASCLSGNGSWFPVFEGGPGGTFHPLASLDGGTSMCDLAAADLNGDRLADLARIDSPVGTTYSATPLVSDGLGGFTGSAWQMGDFPVTLAVADLDGDGRPDVLTKNEKIPDYSRLSYTIRRNLTPVPTTGLDPSPQAGLPVPVALHAWPNPVAGRPVLALTLPRRADVVMQLLDVAGRVVRREHFAGLEAGEHRLRFSGEPPAPGFYIAQVQFGGRRIRTPLVVLR